VLDFSPSALPDLTPVQKSKLIKILGARYNPQTDTVRMSSEHHPTSAQNKRHLATTLDAILKECREGKDTFEDVPFDFRHHKEKIVHKFPEEWKITDERKQYLKASRAKALEAEQAKVIGDAQVDGRRVIDSMLASGLAQAATQQREAVRVPAGRGGAQPRASRQRR
jgi:small subunit ribosomal protein S35